MNEEIFEALALLNEAEDMEALCRIFERIMCKYGFDLFAMQFTPNEYRVMNRKPFAVATYEKEWVDYYFEQNYHLIDPVIGVGVKSKTPFLWSDGWQGLELSKKQKTFFSEAMDYGVGVGVGIPVFSPYHTNGMVSLVSSVVTPEEVKRIVTDNALALQLISNQFQQKAEFFAAQTHDKKIHDLLTDREKECLKWAAVGKSDREIGTILNISHRTVNHHMAHAMRKLEANSREYAVVKALMSRIIQV